MKKYDELSEKLLDGWLRMSMTIWNRRLVSAMTYNESMVCNLLTKQYKADAGSLLTPTDLCSSLQIRKSQMNVILNGLEAQEIIQRVRSKQDRRNVYIKLTEKGHELYQKAHEEILSIPLGLIERLGEEKIRDFADAMWEMADSFDEMMRKKN